MKFPAKPILLALISTTIISSGKPTPEPDRVITPDKIEERNDIWYEGNQTAPFTGLVQDVYPNGKKQLEVNLKDGKPQGVYTRWHENGQKKEAEVNFKDGQKSGVQTLWGENGQKKSEGNYKDGKRQGVHTSWHENGQKEHEWNFKDGKPHGVQIWWQKDGKKKSEVRYENGVRKD